MDNIFFILIILIAVVGASQFIYQRIRIKQLRNPKSESYQKIFQTIKTMNKQEREVIKQQINSTGYKKTYKSLQRKYNKLDNFQLKVLIAVLSGNPPVGFEWPSNNNTPPK